MPTTPKKQTYTIVKGKKKTSKNNRKTTPKSDKNNKHTKMTSSKRSLKQRNATVEKTFNLTMRDIRSGDKPHSVLVDFLKTNVDAIKYQNYLMRTLNHYLDIGDTKLVKQVIDISNIDVLQTDNTSLGILMLRYLVLSNNLKQSVILYQNLLKSGKTRKRHLSIIISSYLKTGKIKDASKLFEKYMDEYEIDEDDIYQFLDASQIKTKYVEQILALVINKPLVFDISKIITEGNEMKITEFDPPKCPNDSKLRLIKFTNEELKQLNEIFRELYRERKQERSYDKYVGFLEKHGEYDYVIDGANIMFYNERSITENSYKRVDVIMDKLTKMWEKPGKPKIQLILHERHFKLKKYQGKQGWNKKSFRNVDNLIAKWMHMSHVTVYKTPVGMNDDWYQIISAVRGVKTVLVTNDQFRDHIFKISNILRIWRKERIAEYDISRDNRTAQIKTPLTYSSRIQFIGGNFCLPLSNGKWVYLS
jgi:hypothetical protein